MGEAIWAAAQDVKIASGETSLAAWFLVPDGPGPHPCVVMGQGFSMTRYDGFAPYAEAFLAAGVAVLAFDYRYFGDSGGTPRQKFAIRAQRADWRAAVAFAKADERIESSQIVAWGFSFGGGFGLEASLRDPDVAAVIALCPFVDGLRRALGTPPALLGWLLPKAIANAAGRHILVPVAAEPGGHAALTRPGELAGFTKVAPADSTWRNEVTPGIFVWVSTFRPVTKAARLRQPLWVGLGERDVTANDVAVARLAERAPRGELHRYDGDHFDVLLRPLADRIAADQLEFLKAAGVLISSRT
ncbi:MAG TPA: alpha/beta fold hydrolase [Mycobacteriales bacterium]|jgi:pimeloyl-ACP methyl ester carboxylesterase|nr:alpha/beta fold hydrolase [Mycobacteriales bacterium]